MMYLRTACAWMALVAWLAPAAVHGQTTTGTILGEVKDSTGGTLPGVTVTAVNQANGLTRETVTDGVGNYRFAAMPAGLYTIKASLTGFKEATRADVRLAI
ncbi:MAG: carboxypeptidase-like regulatory domain-containing protein, partial [Vicinamibacterales bacterium]